MPQHPESSVGEHSQPYGRGPEYNTNILDLKNSVEGLQKQFGGFSTKLDRLYTLLHGDDADATDGGLKQRVNQIERTFDPHLSGKVAAMEKALAEQKKRTTQVWLVVLPMLLTGVFAIAKFAFDAYVKGLAH